MRRSVWVWAAMTVLPMVIGFQIGQRLQARDEYVLARQREEIFRYFACVLKTGKEPYPVAKSHSAATEMAMLYVGAPLMDSPSCTTRRLGNNRFRVTIDTSIEQVVPIYEVEVRLGSGNKWRIERLGVIRSLGDLVPEKQRTYPETSVECIRIEGDHEYASFPGLRIDDNGQVNPGDKVRLYSTKFRIS